LSGNDRRRDKNTLQTLRTTGGSVKMSEQDKMEAQHLRDLFEGAKGRQPKTDQELNDWLATPEGKAATVFESTSLSRWGEVGRS
jgi:hypothetical protein